jgi:hypothetical protein
MYLWRVLKNPATPVKEASAVSVSLWRARYMRQFTEKFQLLAG